MRMYPILFFLIFYSLIGFSQYPISVQKNLDQAGENKKELVKAITHFKNQTDAKKLQALYFLIANMHNHFGVDYYWADATNRRIPFNELDYKDEASANFALAKLKERHPGLHPVQFIKYDLKSLSGAELINNIDMAFSQWKKSSYLNIPFGDFCEFILPHRVSVEPYQSWRKYYGENYSWISDKLKADGLDNMLRKHASMFAGSWGKLKRTEPLPRLGAQQLILRKSGLCEDGVPFTIFGMRSQGIPCAENIVPYWATSSYGHFFATIYDAKMKAVNYEQSTRKFNRELTREPGKVFRITYAEQQNTLASILAENDIPPGILRSKTYRDVTSDYWPTANITSKIRDVKAPQKIVFACVFNGLRWRPIWWSKNENRSFTFANMSKGVVYLPSYYVKQKLVPAGYPIALGYNNQRQLMPDMVRKQSIEIHEEEAYLRFKPGMNYRLYYWDHRWKLLQNQIAKNAGQKMVFNNVPTNSLFLLIPQKPIGKERPFIITDDNQRVWF